MTPQTPEYVTVGLIVSAVGIHGEVRVDPATDFPEERFKPGAALYIDAVSYAVERARQSKEQFVLKLAAVDDRTGAEALRGRHLEIPTDQVPALAPEDGYYYYQLEGLEVWTEADRLLGTVAEILSSGGNDNFIVRDTAGTEVLIPAIDEVVLSVDLEAGRITIRPLPGLLELNA